MSLRWRIAVAMFSLAAVVASLACIGAYVMTRNELRSSLDRALRTQATDVGSGPSADETQRDGDGPDGVDGDGDGGPAGDPDGDGCPPVGLVRTLDAAQVVAPGGAVSMCLPDGPLLPSDELPTDGSTASNDTVLWTVEVAGHEFRVASAPYYRGGTLMIAREADVNDAVLASLRRWLIVLTLCAGVVAGAVGWFVARRLVRPVVRLRDTAHDIAATGDLSTRIDVHGVGEVGDLARSFSSMVDSLATSREQQRRLVADAGHELRTPLTSLSTNVELLGRLDELPAEERPEVLRALRGDVRELRDLTSELVDLATDRSSDEPVQHVDLAELAGHVAAVWRRRSGRSIEVLASGQGTIEGRPQMLERCIGNLVQNAVKYSPADTPIEVQVSVNEVRVLDRGPGIGPAEATRVFERFYRTDTARSVPGSGLGLAIVQQVVDRHRGVVWATERAGGGADVGFRLPDAGSSASA